MSELQIPVLPETALAPAPWDLVGSGLIVALRLPQDVLDHGSFTPPGCVFRGCRSTSPRDVGPGFRRKPVQWRAGRMYFG